MISAKKISIKTELLSRGRLTERGFQSSYLTNLKHKKKRGKILKTAAFCVGCLALLFLLAYAVFLEKSVRAAGEIERLFRDNKKMSAKVSELESSYEKLRGVITIEEAKMLGFSDSDIIFIYPKSRESVAKKNDGK